MNAATAGQAFGAAATRIATATSIIRTRRSDGERRERHAGVPADTVERLTAAAERLEKAAAKLEKSIR